MLYWKKLPCSSHSLSAPPCCSFDSDGLTGNSLADNSAIVLDGGPPQPVSVSLATGTSDSTTYGLGEFIRLTVTFDKSVTVDGASPPVLVLDCTRAREAVFDGGGDGTTTLSFEYEVYFVFVLPFCLLASRVCVSGLTAKLSRLRGSADALCPP